MRPLLALIRKEFQQFFGGKFLPRLVLMFPLMIMLVMPWVATMEVRNVGICLVDADHSSLSRQLHTSLDASPWLDVAACVPSYDSALRMVENGDADVIVHLPAGWEKSLATPTPKSVFVAANSVNAQKSSLGMSYVVQTIAQVRANNHLPLRTSHFTPQTSSSFLFNPTLEYKHFMIPALMIMLLVMLCGFLPALNIVGEKEVGTIEQINVTPIGQVTFVLGKIIPYWIMGLLVLSLAMLLAGWVYGLWPQGNVGVIYLGAVLFIVVMSGFGILIANLSETMQQAMLVMFFFVMVLILMSGLMTPVQSMPRWAQKLTVIVPPRYFVDVMRATYLRGATLAEQGPSLALLALFASLLSLAAVGTYRKKA